MTAAATLRQIQLQADPAGAYSGRRHEFDSSEPSLQFNKYVRVSFLGDTAHVDMVHFFVVGPRGEAIGELLEDIQMFERPHSARDPQDYMSNWFGARFFLSRPAYYSPNRGALSAQLRAFFEAYDRGEVRLRLPPGGVPSVSREVRERLQAHGSEAISIDRFLTYVRSLEGWLAQSGS